MFLQAQVACHFTLTISRDKVYHCANLVTSQAMPTSLGHFPPSMIFPIPCMKISILLTMLISYPLQNVSGLLVSADECRLCQALSWPGLPSASPTTQLPRVSRESGTGSDCKLQSRSSKKYLQVWVANSVWAPSGIFCVVSNEKTARNRQVKSILGHLFIILSTS